MNPAAPVSFFGKIPSTGKSISTDDAIAVIYLSGFTGLALNFSDSAEKLKSRLIFSKLKFLFRRKNISVTFKIYQCYVVVVVVVVVHIYSARLGTPPHGVEKTLQGLKWFTIPPLYLHVTNVSLYRFK